ncbi:hypothetical protein [Salinisphaera sp.]|uniref:hypothetical protein n=1 Tax=Salinisphaera sp. TaxID=1914330 RepID=UPI002D783127|nr:hypothetical protein [Salinisphaera sp.]HET7313954.1 hypothetical protein [Salinisphaera sp.]
MEEQRKQQPERFQNEFKSMFDANQKMMESAVRSSEVAIDSLNQLAKDQYEFNRSCLEIGRRQMESLQTSNDATGLFRETGASSDYYNASLRYGEALRQNAEHTRDRMMAIGREATDTAAGASAQAYQQAAAQAERANQDATAQAERANQGAAAQAEKADQGVAAQAQKADDAQTASSKSKKAAGGSV